MNTTFASEAASNVLDTNPITVYLIDDHRVVREGLAAILGREPDLHVVGNAPSAETALEELERLDPIVVVVDQRLPGMSGIDLCREIAQRRLRAQTVILSAFLEDEAVEAALAAGARAYVVKDVESGELKRAIRAAASGHTSIDPKVAGKRVTWVTRLGQSQANPLSPSQMRVLRLVVEGKTSARIAREVGLSVHTVKGYLKEIYRRLGVRSKAEATAVALRRGIV